MSLTATATLDNGWIRLKTPFSMKDVVKTLPGARWDPKRRIWSVPATPAGAKAVCELLPEANHEIIALAKTVTAAHAVHNWDDLPPIPICKTKPWQHQLKVFWFVARLWGGLPGGRT